MGRNDPQRRTLQGQGPLQVRMLSLFARLFPVQNRIRQVTMGLLWVSTVFCMKVLHN